MASKESRKSPELIAALCHELAVLARFEEEVAAVEAARTPYWSPCPPSVEGHRSAARALRADAAQLERELQTLPEAS
jgi:hypothetical protein